MTVDRVKTSKSPPPGRANETQDGLRDVQVHMVDMRHAKFCIGQVVHHRIYPFRGIIFDVDPTFSNTEEWWQAIPEEIRPAKDQPYYHLLAENDETEYLAYVSEQNLLPDHSGKPIRHPQVDEIFEMLDNGNYAFRDHQTN